MSTPLTAQTIIISTPTDNGAISATDVLSNATVQNWFRNSAGNSGGVISGAYVTIQLDGSYLWNTYIRLDLFVSAIFAATILTDIVTLRTQFPFVTITLFSNVVTFGT